MSRVVKLSDGVEWALHCCLNLAVLEPGTAVTAARLASFHDLPTAYLNKHLQALAREGIVSSSRGPGGGFRLARPAAEITLLDVVVAIEGRRPAFRCTEIRAQGTSGSWGSAKAACTIDTAMRSAELAWRESLAGQSIADLVETFVGRYPGAPGRFEEWFTRA
ncbi:RrF2 family transcriptional regulator [Actinokineospora sp. HUAS TT18]|uniref:RrF2 family transcriptional regulator n=1 Tax=Actinokineospora sp. HUAS TT18 TaxID=3447451 RepID=UPI003F5280F6